jgi:hypothetical protein
MPAGFAPLLGIDAIFVTPKSHSQAQAFAPPPAAPLAPNLTRPEPSAPSAANVAHPEPSAPPTQSVRRSEPPPPSAQSVARSEPVTSLAANVAQPEPAAPSNPNLTRSGSAVGAGKKLIEEPRPTHSAPAGSDAPAAAPGPVAPVIPRIINRPEAVAESAPMTTGTVVKNETSPPQARVLGAHPEAPVPETSSLVSVRAALVVLTGVLVALGALTLLIVRGLAPSPLGSDSGQRNGQRTGQRTGTRSDVATRREPTLASPVWSTTAASSSTWNDEVPRTRSDALRVLGMGVANDANRAAIKKIVDGLRQTWHPDLARDPADREIRERRMKQINVAWDILGAKAAQS